MKSWPLTFDSSLGLCLNRFGAGIHFWGDLDIEASFVRDGANLLIHGSEIELFAKHLSEELESLRRAPCKTSPAPRLSSQTINF
jgi:hypothetical protein